MSTPWRDIPLVDIKKAGPVPFRDIPLQEMPKHKPATTEDQDRAAEMSRLLLAATEPATPVSTAVEPPKTRVQRIIDDRDEQERLAMGDGREISITAPTPDEQIDEENERYYNTQAERGYGMGAMGGRPAGGFMAKATAPETKPLEEATPQEVNQARMYLMISDLVDEKGAHGAKKYLQDTGLLQKEPIVERFFNAVVGKKAGIMEQELLTGPEKVAADIAGMVTGFVLPSKIVQAGGVTGRTALSLRRARLPEKLAEMGGRAIGGGATFGLRGAQEATAQEMSPEDAAKHITNMTLMGAGLGGTLAVPNKAIRVPATAMYGYLVSRLSGASQVDSAVTAAVFMLFGVMTRRDISFEVKNTIMKRKMSELDDVLRGNGIPSEISKGVQREMYRRYAAKVNPTLDDFIKLEDDIAALIRKEARYTEALKELPVGKAEPVPRAVAKGMEIAPATAEVPAREPLFATGKGKYAGEIILDPRKADKMPALQAITGVKAAKDYPGLLEGVRWGLKGKSPVGSYGIVSRDKSIKQDYDVMDSGELPQSFIERYGEEAIVDRSTGDIDFDKLVALAEQELHDVTSKMGEYAPVPEEGRIEEITEKPPEKSAKAIKPEIRPEVPVGAVAKRPGEERRPIWANELESVGGKIEKGGTVSLYHATTKEKAQQIMKEGLLRRPKDTPDSYGVYLSSSKSVAQDYGDGTVIRVRVDARDLNPDDIFAGERMDFSVETKRGVYRPISVESVTPVEAPKAPALRMEVQEVGKIKPKREQVALGLGVQAKIPAEGIRAPEGAPAPEEGAPLWEARKEEAAREAEKRQVELPSLSDAEVTKLYAATGPIDPELVRSGIREAQSLGVAGKKIAERLVRRGATHMRKLGEGGAELAKDIDEIAFDVRRETNNDDLDIRKAMRGLTPKERTRAAMVTDKEIPANTQTEKVVERSEHLRQILDRQLKEFAAVGGQRRLGGPGEEKIPAGGGGRAFPQVPNKEGRAVLQEVAAGAMKPGWDMTPKVAKAVEWLVEMGWAKNYDEAVFQLIKNKEVQLRSINPYFERTRTPLPTYLREWDPFKVLSGSMERNWMTIEGIRKWGWDELGMSFPKANELIGKIAQEHPFDADVVHQFIRSSFGLGSKASESAQRISRDLRAVQFIGKIAVSPLTITRNMIDRFAKVYTTAGLSITLRATLKFPPYLNVWIKSARRVKEQMIRSGAVFSHGSIAEGVEPGTIVMSMIGKPFTSSERGNQVMEALGAKMKLERDIQLYLNAKPDSRLGNLFKAIQNLGENTEAQIAERIKEAGLAGKTTEEMVDILIKSKGADMPPIEVQAVMHRAARDQAFPVILSTKRLWWDDSPLMKVLAQFKVWPVEQLSFIYRSAMKQAIKGNVVPLMRFIIGVTIAGELYNIARDYVYEKEEALLTNLRRRPDKHNVKDIAWILYKDALDGGMIGMFADLTWGLTDWVLGPTAGTIGELGKTMLAALRRPGLTIHALKKAMRRDVSAIRQAEGILNKVGVLVGKDGKRAVLYNRWRFRANEYWREQHVGLYEKVEKAIMGPPSYPVGKNSLVYELIARNITANDIESAAEYIEILFSKKDTFEERKKLWSGLKQSRARRSPLGPVALKNRREFFSSFSQRDKDEAEKLQKAWLADYNRAIKLVTEEKRLPSRESPKDE